MIKRSTLGGGALLALALLFIGLTVLFNYALRGWRLDLTAEPSLHHGRRHRADPRRAQGADQSLLLLLREGRAAAAAAEDLRHARARIARGAGGALQRQAAPARDRSAAVLGRRRPRGGARRARRARWARPAAQFYFGLAGTNSTDGHAGHRVLRSATRNSSSSTTSSSSSTSSPIPRSRWSAGCRACRWTAALRSAERARCASRGWCTAQAQQLFDVRPLEPTAAQDRPGHQRAGGRASEGAVAGDAVRDRPVRAARRAHPGVRRSARRGRHAGADPHNPMAAMTADKSSHLGRAARTPGACSSTRHEVVADRGHALR